MATTPNGLPYPLPGEPVTDGAADIQALAEAMDGFLPVVIRKTADQSVTNSAAFIDDLHLKVTLAPGTYRVQALLSVIGATGGDIKTTWTFAGTQSSSQRACTGPETGATTPAASMTRATAQSITSVASYGTEPATPLAAVEDLHIIVTAGGVLQFRWAQNTASATATTVQANSRIYAQKVA